VERLTDNLDKFGIPILESVEDRLKQLILGTIFKIKKEARNHGVKIKTDLDAIKRECIRIIELKPWVIEECSPLSEWTNKHRVNGFKKKLIGILEDLIETLKIIKKDEEPNLKINMIVLPFTKIEIVSEGKVKDKLYGGLADELPDEMFDPEQLAIGIEVEMEHTNDKDLAKEIAKDHIREHPNYYTLLKDMEAKAKGTDIASNIVGESLDAFGIPMLSKYLTEAKNIKLEKDLKCATTSHGQKVIPTKRSIEFLRNSPKTNTNISENSGPKSTSGQLPTFTNVCLNSKQEMARQIRDHLWQENPETNKLIQNWLKNPSSKHLRQVGSWLNSTGLVRLRVDDSLIRIVFSAYVYEDNIYIDNIRKIMDKENDKYSHLVEESEYRGRKVKLNKPFRTPDGPKKFSVYVKNDNGNVVKVNFGDPKMRIRRNNPKRRKNFRARHRCNDPGPKWKARYWSCQATWNPQKTVAKALHESEKKSFDEIISELSKLLRPLKYCSRGKCVHYSEVVNEVFKKFGYAVNKLDLTVDGMNHTVSLIDDEKVVDFTLSQFIKEKPFPYITMLNSKEFKDVYEMDLPIEIAKKPHTTEITSSSEAEKIVQQISKKIS
jgi:hypothetical protein